MIPTFLPRFALFAVFFGLACVQSAAAATYYVSPSGSDTSKGTSTAPFRTIQKAVDSVEPGDTVIVRDGVYTGNDDDVFAISRSGSAEKWITIKAENRWGAILDGRNFKTAHGVILEQGLSYVRFEGLQIQNTIGGGFSASEKTHDIYYYGNLIHDIGHICSDGTGGLVGFRDKSTSYRMVYDSNVIHSIGRRHPSDGCFLLTGNYKNHDHGMYLHGRDVKIINNVFYGLKSGWAIQSSEGAADWVIAQNTFAFSNPNREGQIVLWDANENFTIANNIFYQPKTAAIALNPCKGKTNIIVRNNISTGDMLYDDDTSRNTCAAVSLTNNRTFTEPRLASPEKLDFHLTAASPAINQADASVSPKMDQEGKARPQGDGFDMGAFEFVAKENASGAR